MPQVLIRFQCYKQPECCYSVLVSIFNLFVEIKQKQIKKKLDT